MVTPPIPDADPERFRRDDLGVPTVVYSYQRSSGDPAFYVCRWEPKTFRPARVRNGRVVWNINDAPPLLYRLPAVETALAQGEAIWIVDGEKDCDALAERGVNATCSARSQGWTADHAEALTGARRVHVVADRDGGRGLQQANEVRQSLIDHAGIASSDITLVQAAEGKDSFDHLQAGKGLDEFEVIEDEPEDGLEKIDLASITAVNPEWIVRGYLPAGELVILQGRGGCNKGTLAASWAALVTRGEGENQSGTPGAVLWATAEDSLATVIKPRLTAAGADIDLVHPLVMRRQGEVDAISLPEDVVALREEIEQTNARLLIVDPLLSHLSGKVDSHRDHDVKKALRPLAQMATETGCTVLGVHHLGKDSTRGALLSGMGSAAFTNTARLVLAMVEDDEDEMVRVLEVVKSNLSKTGLRKSLRVELVLVPGLADPVPRTIEDGDAAKSVDELLGGVRPKRGAKSAAVKEILMRELAIKPRSLDYIKAVCASENVDISENTVWRAAHALKAEERVRSYKDGFDGGWLWALTIPEASERTSPLDAASIRTSSFDQTSPKISNTTNGVLRLKTGDLRSPTGEVANFAITRSVGEVGATDAVRSLISDPEAYRLLSVYRPGLVGRDDLCTVSERRQLAALLLAQERAGVIAS